MPTPILPVVANVEYVRPELTKYLARWGLVSDCIGGQEEIKARGDTYLPRPNATDKSAENEARFAAYLLRAVFYNVTGRTLQGMLGTVFQKHPELEMPDELDILNEDADGAGVGLEQQAKKALSFVLSFGRAGLLVDYPELSAPASKAQMESGDIHPNILLFFPWQVINWRTTLTNGRKLLSLVVIAETYVAEDDGFEAKVEKQYRVLRLVDGVYKVQIHRQVDKVWQVVESTPTDADGKLWDFIPFTFVGAENNDDECDLPPLYDLAALNVAHYRNSADYEEACYLLGQPTPWASGLTEEWVTKVLKGTIALGSRAVIPLPESGAAGLLQVAPNTMPKEGMEHKEKQMVALGAKLVEQRDVRQTATEASQNEASETSVLATSANNVSSAYTDALKWCAKFAGVESDEIKYKLSTEFEKRFASATDLLAIVQMWQANAISDVEMRQVLTKTGVATQDMEKWKEAIETAGPDLSVPVKAQELADKEAESQMKADALAAKSEAAKKPAAPAK